VCCFESRFAALPFPSGGVITFRLELFRSHVIRLCWGHMSFLGIGIDVFLYTVTVVYLGASIADRTCSGVTIARFICWFFPGHDS